MTEPLLFLEEGVVRLSFTARIERAQFHRARSVSKKGHLTTPSSFLPRPRVARAQEADQASLPHPASSDASRESV